MHNLLGEITQTSTPQQNLKPDYVSKPKKKKRAIDLIKTEQPAGDPAVHHLMRHPKHIAAK
jgi:hypothetical protein